MGQRRERGERKREEESRRNKDIVRENRKVVCVLRREWTDREVEGCIREAL